MSLDQIMSQITEHETQRGSLAVDGGRDLAPTINHLLSLPYTLKVATKDFHPHDHVSFHTSYADPTMKPFGSSAPIKNPTNPSEIKEISLWPRHCVQDTEGAQLIPELDASRFDVILEKGKDKSVEMLSAFADVFGNKTEAASLDLSGFLRSYAIDCVHVVGLAGDVCVKHTALDARKEGFKVFVIKEGVRSVDEGSEGWGATVKTLQNAKVEIVSIGSPEITALA